MGFRTARRGALIGLAAAGAVLCGALPALAAPGDASAYAIKVDATVAGVGVSVGPLAAANTSGPTHNSLVGMPLNPVLVAKVLNTVATRDDATGVVHASASVADVDLNALDGVGGDLKITAVKAVCDATQTGTTGATTLAGVSLPYGLPSPSVTPAANSVIELSYTDPVTATKYNVAKLVLNEQIHNPDGSLTVNAVHLTLLGVDAPGVGTLAKGNVIISSATCGPAAPPVPLASGTG